MEGSILATENIENRQGAAGVSTEAIVEELKAKIKRLKSTVDHLSQENDSLEHEVQGFMSEVHDQKRYHKEKDKEIDMLNEQIKKLKKESHLEDCKECPQKLEYIKKLEGLQRQNKFKIVELQTKYYDMQNKMKEDMKNWEEKERRLQYNLTKLEQKLGEITQPESRNAEVQCDVMNFEQLLEKYVKIKKLARMRRDEANALRAKLGIEPDEPVS